MEETTAFPRGGRRRRDLEEPSPSKKGGDGVDVEKKQKGRREERKTKREEKKKKKRRHHQDDDILFGQQQHPKQQRTPSNNKRSRRHRQEEESRPPTSSKSMLPIGGGGCVVHKNANNSKSSSYIEPLSFQKLQNCGKLFVLACCKEVHADIAIFSLPNMWTGYMLRADNIPKLDEMLTVNQILYVQIIKAVQEKTKDGQQNHRRRIQVTVLPDAVNPPTAGNVDDIAPGNTIVRGRIASVEDHGYIIDLGRSRSKGFFAFDQIIIPEGSLNTITSTSTTMTAVGNSHNQGRQQSQPSSLQSLHVNRISDFVVRDDQPVVGNIVPLKLLPDSSHKKKKQQQYTNTNTTLSDLRPGTIVHDVIVEYIFRNGIGVAFGKFRGSIELVHLGSVFVPTEKHENTNWKNYFNIGKRIPIARILAVDATTKLIRLSLLPHLLLQMQQLAPSPALLHTTNVMVGDVVENCTVVRVDPGVGALLALPNQKQEGEDIMAEENEEENRQKQHNHLISTEPEYIDATRVRTVYVHISKAMDNDNDKDDKKVSEAVFGKEFAPSTKHTVRIVSSGNSIEDVLSGATAPSIVNAHILTYDDIQPGQIFKQVPVCSQCDGGSVLVDFGMGIRGLIPALHLFEQAGSGSGFRNKMRKVKYSVGAKVDVRVLSVDKATKKCILTAKKLLVNKELDEDNKIITSYDDVRVGQHAVGFVSKIDKESLYVTFFNGVFGRVTARSLVSELGIENHMATYHRGDVVECRIVNVKKRLKKQSHWQQDEDDDDDMDMDEEDADRLRYYRELTLSLRLDVEEAVQGDSSEKRPQCMVQLKAGTILPLKSLRVVELVCGKEKERGYVPGYALVSIKSKYMVGEAEAATMPAFIECKLPYDQLLDQYKPEDIESASTLDELGERMLTVGKKINRKGLVLVDPHKTVAEYSSATGHLTTISIRPELMKTVESRKKEAEEEVDDDDDTRVLVPSPDTHFYAGMLLQGYVIQVDQRHGAFIRFLDEMTGLIPKRQGGLLLQLFSTVIVKVVSVDDKIHPPRILLGLTTNTRKPKGYDGGSDQPPELKPGDVIERAKIESINFHRIRFHVLDEHWSEHKRYSFQMHCTMADSTPLEKEGKLNPGSTELKISSFHPFYKMKEGDILTNLSVAAVEKRPRGYSWIVELSNRKNHKESEHAYFDSPEVLSAGDAVSGIVTAVKNQGIWLQLSPKVSGRISGLDISEHVDVLNNIERHFPVGARLNGVVLDKQAMDKTRFKLYGKHKGFEDNEIKHHVVYLSLLRLAGDTETCAKPQREDLIVGRINRSLPTVDSLDLMLDLRGGFVGRCCITELGEVDDWTNFPLGRSVTKQENSQEPGVADTADRIDGDSNIDTPFAHGMFVQCRVLAGVPSKPMVEVSLRNSRIEGDCDDDEAPEVGDIVQAYVARTSKMGCFLRLSRQIEGRTILKELCDGYLPNPAASFPPGRLVVGKIKVIKKAEKEKRRAKLMADVDMRESMVIDNPDEKIQFDEVEIGRKYKGTVTRIEDYGVFVRIENSEVTGLVHKSECSDLYIKNLSELYDPGDLVKLLVLKKDGEKKQIGFSMKASHFEDDEDSDDDSSLDEGSGSEADELEHSEADGEFDSDDENYVAKLAAEMSKKDSQEGSNSSSSDESDASSSSASDSEESSQSNEAPDDEHLPTFDTNVGFDWNESSAKSKNLTKDISDEDSDSDEDEDDAARKSSHKSRKKQAQRRREEQEIARRETALADGTADENPETSADFERLLAGDPNSSELWIKYMAFHLALANIAAARDVANRAFSRIEFRQEKEKLNVWCALLTLELKYGSGESLNETLDRACQHNNPKRVYLRMCEIMEKQSSTASPETVVRTDGMFLKMCKKFRDKKKVWIAHMEYLLRNSRHEEAHALSKRALLSLKPYKHVETMSKFAQLVFEYGSAEKARTIFDGILRKYPKRLDILFVYADKEVKHGELDAARALFSCVANPDDERVNMKLSDKQMKRFFKKWFSFEELHGTEESREKVKDAARSFVERTTWSS